MFAFFLFYFASTCDKYGNSGGPLVNLVSYIFVISILWGFSKNHMTVVIFFFFAIAKYHTVFSFKYILNMTWLLSGPFAIEKWLLVEGVDSVKVWKVTQSLTFTHDICDAPARRQETYQKLSAT